MKKILEAHIGDLVKKRNSSLGIVVGKHSYIVHKKTHYVYRIRWIDGGIFIYDTYRASWFGHDNEIEKVYE